MSMDYMIYMGIIALFGLLGTFVGNRLKSKFEEYSQMPTSSGLTGAEMARKMLQHYGINDVQIREVDGFLSDHYNPVDKTVNLSSAVYSQRTVAAAAVACHECGHAVQHATAYSMLTMRSKLVPIVNVAASVQQYVLMGALAGFAGGMGSVMLLAATVIVGATALFSLVTLPVEFDASNRALAWLDETGFVKGEEYDGAKDALNWAARTYIVAALSGLASFLYLLMKLLASRNRNS